MKTSKLLLICAIFLGLMACNTSNKQNEDGHQHESDNGHGDHQASEEKEASKAGSPREAAMANVGEAHVHIDYASPSVRGRIIWGGLVPYDKVWVTGAHRATSINFYKDVKIRDQVIPKGKYAFFTIPGKDAWTVIINKNWEQHLADEYDESDDVLRFTVVPEDLEEPQESLTFEVISTGENTGLIAMSWEKLKISFEVATV